jgi:radical SAM superfamily enzyme YgiQ (UPF0313 family)
LADITLANMNMLYVRYLDRVEREIHLPLGPLHVARSLEDAGFDVDFRDFQVFDRWDLFSEDAIADFLSDSADVLFVSCMANLLPFTLLALRSFKRRNPRSTIVLGGVGPFAVEEQVLEVCPWVDVVGVGEGERYVPLLAQALRENGRIGRSVPGAGTGELHLENVPSVVWRKEGRPVRNPLADRIEDLDALPFPAYHLVDLARYDGINMLSSRGCPFPCTFCSVAPIWGRRPVMRSGRRIVEEMRYLHEARGAELFLFQDEYFVSTKERTLELCRAISKAGFDVRWKAFGRVDLTDLEVMEAMADAGCVELRYGIESGSDHVLTRTKKGFDADQALDVLSQATSIFPGVDAFYMWGFPFETMDDFQQTLLHMVAARAMGVRILPSLVCYLPQTDLYREVRESRKLEFCPELFPEYMLTGHETCADGKVEISAEHQGIYRFINEHPTLFPGYFHVDVEGNVRPKYQLLQRFGFYSLEGRTELLGSDIECCGAHQPD